MFSGPRRLRWIALIPLLVLVLAVAHQAAAQDPGDVPLPWQAVDENDPNGPVATTMRELQAFHDEMVKHPPRVQLHPVVPNSNGFWPMGYTDGIDDPSGGAIAQGLRNTWSNMDTLAYTQHVYRERRAHRRERCPKCQNVK